MLDSLSRTHPFIAWLITCCLSDSFVHCQQRTNSYSLKQSHCVISGFPRLPQASLCWRHKVLSHKKMPKNATNYCNTMSKFETLLKLVGTRKTLSPRWWILKRIPRKKGIAKNAKVPRIKPPLKFCHFQSETRTMPIIIWWKKSHNGVQTQSSQQNHCWTAEVIGGKHSKAVGHQSRHS